MTHELSGRIAAQRQENVQPKSRRFRNLEHLTDFEYFKAMSRDEEGTELSESLRLSGVVASARIQVLEPGNRSKQKFGADQRRLKPETRDPQALWSRKKITPGTNVGQIGQTSASDPLKIPGSGDDR